MVANSRLVQSLRLLSNQDIGFALLALSDFNRQGHEEDFSELIKKYMNQKSVVHKDFQIISAMSQTTIY